MAGPRTARGRARAQMLEDLRQAALELLASEGGPGLSLRGVARAVGIVPSGVYRYYASRDELVTALLEQSYADLAAAVAARNAGRADPREGWVVGCHALRDWARAEPARFHLVYGTPIPGYAAPADTVGPAAAVVVTLLRPLDGAWADAPPLPDQGRVRGAGLDERLVATASGLGLDLPPDLLARALGALAEVIGLVMLELGGHFVGTFEPADALFADAVEQTADRLGLRAGIEPGSVPGLVPGPEGATAAPH